MKSTLATLALQVGTVLGAPATLLAREAGFIYGPFDSEDTRMAYGDRHFNFGDRVPSSFLDAIAEGCSSLGCDPGQTFEISVLQINGASVGSDVSITMTVDAEFNGVSDEQRPGSKAHLLALAKLAFQEVYNTGVATVETGVPYRKNPCPPSQVHGCAGQSGGTADQWTSTDKLTIRVNARDPKTGELTDGLAGSLKIKFERSDDDSSNGVCAALSAISAGAGLANQYVGFGVGLASIVCGELMD